MELLLLLVAVFILFIALFYLCSSPSIKKNQGKVKDFDDDKQRIAGMEKLLKN